MAFIPVVNWNMLYVKTLYLRILLVLRHPVFITIASFKRKHHDLIEKVFLETIDYEHNKDLIDLDSISLDESNTGAYANKSNNLTEEDVQKLLHIIEQQIIENQNKIPPMKNN
ncbi:MAG: hypothetical protein IJJ47_02800 [Methanosphaera sp.]|nr:hypothetical protein [Methanosphaera sp.]